MKDHMKEKKHNLVTDRGGLHTPVKPVAWSSGTIPQATKKMAEHVSMKKHSGKTAHGRNMTGY